MDDRIADKQIASKNCPDQEAMQNIAGFTWAKPENGAPSPNNPIDPTDRQYLCFSKEAGGQYLERGNFTQIKDEMRDVMQQVVEKVSKDNNGAAILVRGDIISRYKDSFCSNGSLYPDQTFAGQGKIEGDLKVPNQEEINKELKDLVDKYKNSLKGEFPDKFNELDLKADLYISSPDPRDIRAQFHQTDEIQKSEQKKS